MRLTPALNLLALIFIAAANESVSAHPTTRPDVVNVRVAQSDVKGPTCAFSVTLRDNESGEVSPGLIRVRIDGGDWIGLPGLLPRGLGAQQKVQATGWHVLTDRTVLKLPKEVVHIEAVRGIDTRLMRYTFDLSQKETHELDIPLERFWNPAERGLVAGNTHVHLKGITRELADRYLVDINRADETSVVFVSYLERAGDDHQYITNLYSREDLVALNQPDLKFGWGEEYRHNFGGGGEGYGHVMLLELPELILPASIGPGIAKVGDDRRPLRNAILEARTGGGTTIWCHNTFGFEDIPNVLDGLIHAHNMFDSEVNPSYEDEYYRYLNLGIRLPISTGTDWFIYDYSRVYVPGKPGISPKAWLAELRAGKTFITNGPLIDFSINDKGPGTIFSVDESGHARLSAKTISRQGPFTLQIVRNGTVIATADSTTAEGLHRAAIDSELPIDEAGWYAARIESESLNELGLNLFAHTSPIYFDFKGERVYSQQAAQIFHKELQRSIDEIEKLGRFNAPEDRSRILDLYKTHRDGLLIPPQF